MISRCKKKRVSANLIFGLLWLVWFFIGMLTKDNPGWIDYGWIVISAMYLILYFFYERENKYLTLENGVLKVNSPFGKKSNLSDVKQIRKFAGDYVLKTDKTELTIHTHIIDPDSLSELNAELEKLNVEGF